MSFISIQLNSNRPVQIRRFFDSIEATADKPETIEVLLHIDSADAVMEDVIIQEQKVRRFSLRVLKTDLVQGYSTLWKPLNPLFAMTHPEADFIINVSDEMLFETKEWDSVVRGYAGYYPDAIFRLRASQFRFRNYTDFWECGFAPDSLAFYTRRWLELCGEWCPCLGPDSFQQCIAFYLYTSDPFSLAQLNRDIPLATLRFSGEGQAVGLKGEARWQRTCINIRAWFTLMSHPMQQEAKRRAMRIKSHIVATRYEGGTRVSENETAKCFQVIGKNDSVIATHFYRLSWLRITVTNLLRIPFLLHYNGSKRASGKHGFRDFCVMMAASCALYLAACLPLHMSGKLLAKAEKLFKRTQASS